MRFSAFESLDVMKAKSRLGGSFGKYLPPADNHPRKARLRAIFIPGWYLAENRQRRLGDKHGVHRLVQRRRQHFWPLRFSLTGSGTTPFFICIVGGPMLDPNAPTHLSEALG
jgi:hypothetical protein